MENLQERNTLIGKIVGELLASNQANSFWRKALIVENEGKPSVLSLLDFRESLVMYGVTLRRGGGSGFIVN